MRTVTVQYIQERLKELGCNILVLSSAYQDLEEALKKLNPKIEGAIEIGTHNGLSAAILTNWAQRVYTFDISLRNSEFIWNLLGVRNKISSFVGNREELQWEVNYIVQNWQDVGINVNFNIAHVDGCHDYEWVKKDFELVKFTGRVLFHDYDLIPGVRQFCDEIGAVSLSKNMGYWEAA